ncbi:hypothetical protein H4219_004136 [Mycoemilia scoparia]|uniref:Uncharacterized protein n=1 Tax=Mycoemilia scoparia TaxID=417184 RepID=A0A9W7ZT60_9FUNG|nr:hypothetical protein H4219_004136 [Mycoemilia scoparia]
MKLSILSFASVLVASVAALPLFGNNGDLDLGHVLTGNPVQLNIQGPNRRDVPVVSGVLANVLGNDLVGSVLAKLSNLPLNVDLNQILDSNETLKGLKPILVTVLGDFNLDIKAFIKIIATITEPNDPNANLVQQIVGKIRALVYAPTRVNLHMKQTKDGQGIVPGLVGPVDADASVTPSVSVEI